MHYLADPGKVIIRVAAAKHLSNELVDLHDSHLFFGSSSSAPKAIALLSVLCC